MANIIKIGLSKPDITAKEKKAVLGVLDSSTLSIGPNIKEFEKKLAKVSNRKYAIAVNSGTSALHLIIRALNIKDGDEVITTPFSFVASSNSILFERAKPVFVDIDKDTLNIDADKIEKKITKKTKAILVVDVFGYPADWEKILKIAKKYKLKVIEDSAEAIGAEYRGRRCGSFGMASIFSFYPNKQITTGEGGSILTDDKDIADACYSMANQGRRVESGEWLEHIQLGYNYRLTEMQAALGIAQLDRLNEILKKREKIARLYGKKLKGVKGVELPINEPKVKRSWFVYVITLPKSSNRDRVIQRMGKQGIQCGNYFYPIHLQPFYKKKFGYKKGDFPVTESVGERTIALPFFSNITEKEINTVVKALKKSL